jgi:hypothetical protein
MQYAIIIGNFSDTIVLGVLWIAGGKDTVFLWDTSTEIASVYAQYIYIYIYSKLSLIRSNLEEVIRINRYSGLVKEKVALKGKNKKLREQK